METDRNDDMTIPSSEGPSGANVYKPQPEKVVEVPSMQEAPKYDSAPVYQQPVMSSPAGSYEGTISAEPPKKKSNKTVWIIVIVVIVLLCCCCIAIIIAANTMMQDANFDIEDLYNEFSRSLQVAPAYVSAFLAL